MQLDEYIGRLEDCSADYSLNVDLSRFCSYGTGGKGAIAVFPENAEQLKRAVGVGFPCEVIGAGTNVLFSDGGYDGAVVCTARMTKIECRGLSIVAECGARLSDVRETAAMNALGGLEFTEGIPATVGGAVCMNAGCFSKCVGDYVSYAVTTDGVLNATECDFGYRSSVFLRQNEKPCEGISGGEGESASESREEEPKHTIVSVCFLLKPGEPDVIESKRERFKKLRKRAQPHGKSCGSVFLNDGYFAGKIIDSVGLKGLSIGGARVSEKHANFILAERGATSRDIYSLISQVKKRVYEAQGIVLKEELRFIGNFDD